MLLASFDGRRPFVVRTLSSAEVNAALNAMRTLNRIYDETQIMLLVMLNQRAFGSAFQTYLDELTENGGMGTERLAYVSLDMNRHLLNALSSFNIFLDHANIDIVRRFGKESEQHFRFTKGRENMYSSVFAYRFLYLLRNYALHCGMPLRVVRAESRADPGGGKTNILTLTVNPTELLANFDKWKTVRAEIQRLGEVEFRPLLREVVACVHNLMALKNDICGEDVLEPLELLESLQRECVGHPGVPYLLPIDFGRAVGVTYRIHDLPLHMMGALRTALAETSTIEQSD
jgi:hypothetical protein